MRLLKLLPALLVKQGDPEPLDASYLLTPTGKPSGGNIEHNQPGNIAATPVSSPVTAASAPGKTSRRRDRKTPAVEDKRPHQHKKPNDDSERNEKTAALTTESSQPAVVDSDSKSKEIELSPGKNDQESCAGLDPKPSSLFSDTVSSANQLPASGESGGTDTNAKMDKLALKSAKT